MFIKHGDAVDIVAQKYKGLAKETADAKTQMNNAVGDFKEAFNASITWLLGSQRRGF